MSLAAPSLHVACAFGVVEVDLEDESVVDAVLEELEPRPRLELGLPLVVDGDRVGARIVAVVDRRPPLVISDDAGTTWRETGNGLPSGTAVAISPDHPDHVAYASEHRLFVSLDGGRFWRSLETELPGITGLRWRSG
ncbi:MAG: hypothetical protein ACKVUT_07885 [Gaiella sp.]